MLIHPSGIVSVLRRCATGFAAAFVVVAAGSAQQASEAQAPAGPVLPLKIGRPAPDLGLVDWLGDKKKMPSAIGDIVRVGGGGDLPDGLPPITEEIEQKIKDSIKGINKAMKAARKQPGDLAQHHKKVVIVHVIDWSEPATSTDLIELVRDAVKANEDREVAAIGIMQAGERSQTRAMQAGVSWPVALTDLRDGKSPYIEPGAQSRVFVIGRSGQLVWRGNPASDRTGFTDALTDAMNQLGVERLERDLGEDFDKALELYYGESLTKALSQAERLQASAKDGDQQRADAEQLIVAAKATELAWLRAMRESGKRRRDFDEYVRNIDALIKACPRTSGKEAKAHEKATSRKSNYGLRLKDERRYQELLEDRPALFPAVKSKENDRFAKKVEKFLKGKRLTAEPERRAQDLLDRYTTSAR